MRLATLVLPVLLLNITACGVKAKNDGTPKFKLDTTQQPTGASPKIEESTSSNVPHQTHLPSADKVRIASLDQLVKTDSLNEKLESATNYVNAMDFQVASYAKMNVEQILKLRSELLAAGLLEFSQAVAQLRGDSWRLSATNKDNQHQSLIALTIAMSEVNVLQSKVRDLAPVSIYDVLSEGLLRKQLVKKRKLKKDQLTKTDLMVADQSKVAQYLLHLRLRGLSVIALGKVTGIQEGILEKFSEWFYTWESKIEELSVAQIKEATRTLNQAILTRNVLYTLKLEGDLDKNVLRALKKMKAKKSFIQQLDKTTEAERIAALERYNTALIGLTEN